MARMSERALEAARICPPILEDPDCTTLSHKFQAAFPQFTSAYTAPITLSQNSVRGYRWLNTCLPPKHDKPINLGPVTDKLLAILPRSEPTFDHFFPKCAIIGSSGHMLNFEHGADIDAHDLVLRFNSAPTKGFEKHVGAKTTHRLTNTRNFNYREYKSEHVYVHMRNSGALSALKRAKAKLPAERLYSLHPAWHRFMDRTYKYLTTSGLNGIILALHTCLEVKLYGFHVHPSMGALYHYYNPDDVPANEGRDDGEWEAVRELVEHGFVSFAEPCIIECHDGKDVCDACVAEHNNKQ